jgi:hypothetical protein
MNFGLIVVNGFGFDFIRKLYNRPNMSQFADFKSCNFCPKKFFTKTGLKIHCSEVHEKQLEIESQVDKTAAKSTLDSKQTINENQNNRYNSDCKVVKDSVQYAKKNADQFKRKKKLFICPICKKELKKNIGLKQHIQFVHEKLRPFMCHICKKEFVLNGDLKRHITTVHEKQKPFKCLTCEKEFGQKSVLKKHTNTVHEKQRPFNCITCDKEFGLKSTLKQHISSVHEKQKTFKCIICQKDYSRKTHLNRHFKSKHPTIQKLV